MEDQDEVICCEEAFEEVDEIKNIKTQLEGEEITTEYLDLGLAVDPLAKTDAYYPTAPKLRRGRRRKLDVKLQSQISSVKPNYSTMSELRLGPKYRPIRPKPYQPTIPSRNKLYGISPSSVNLTTLSSPNRFIVTTPLPNKDKIRDVAVANNSSNKINNFTKPTNGNVASTMTDTKENNSDRNVTSNLNQTAVRKDSHNVKTSTKCVKDSIELFFESMAQTVLNLPMQVQAEIKMEICKLVTMAEIKYCGSQSKYNHKTG